MLTRPLTGCLTLIATLIATLFATGLQAQTLTLDFLPPPVEPQDLCQPAPDLAEDDPSLGISPESDLAQLHLRWLRRDIRALTAEDPDRWFDFLMDLLALQRDLDPDMSDVDLLLAQIALHIDAGRLDQLEQAGLIPRLRATAEAGNLRLTGQNRLDLAQYYLNGIGVAPDIPYAQGLIRDAAFAGNVDALMMIARMNQAGQPMPGWEAPMDLTVSLAFGGMLGAMDAGVCLRAERIAREYLDGLVVTPNPATALAWYKFAADLGSAQAAWRVVEFHLSATAPTVDNVEMLTYLQRAADRGFRPDAGQTDELLTASDIALDDLRRILGDNISLPEGEGRPSLARHLQMAVNPDALDVSENGPYLEYLRRLAQIPTAPGFVFTRLATEIAVKEGRWAAEAEIIATLEEAVLRGDPQGMRDLAQRLLRYRMDPAQLSRAISLISQAATQGGLPPALQDMEAVFRCQSPGAPHLTEASHWAALYEATEHDAVDISPTDLLVAAPWREPETIARIQRQALMGRVEALAQQLERVQMDLLLGDSADRIWADRTDGSAKALELFAELEFTLATTPAERDRAVELFRRVYLHNGVTTALDLAVALVEHAGRDPAVADEVVTLLTQAGNRGEGASIRLLARLQADTRPPESLYIDARPTADVYAEFATAIAERGDFLALMFAIPFVDPATAADYRERAVSLMSCSSKDIDELGAASLWMQDEAQAVHWQRIGLTIPGGHIVSRLALSARQTAAYGTRAVPDQIAVLAREQAEGGGQGRGLYALLSDPDAPGYDPARAAGLLVDLLRSGAPGDEGFALSAYRAAPPDLRAAIDATYDLTPAYERAAAAGDPVAQYDYALVLQAQATGPAGLTAAAAWLARAAEGGHVPAMTAWGQALALGLGTAPDRVLALVWLDRARGAGDARAAELAHLLRLAP